MRDNLDMNRKTSTIYAFIDSQILNLGVRDLGWRLDFGRFRVYLKDKYKVEKAFLFIGYVAKNQPLYTQLQKDGYIVIFKPTLEVNKGGKVVVKGNVDAELVLHTMIELPNYNQAVIVTGDGDFYCLVDHLNKIGKLLRLLVPNEKKYSGLLKSFAPNKIDFISHLKSKLDAKVNSNKK